MARKKGAIFGGESFDEARWRGDNGGDNERRPHRFLARAKEIWMKDGQPGGQGDLRLFRAIACDNAGLVRRLLNEGADLEAWDWEGKTPLSLAANAGRRHIARELLGAGARPDAVDAKGWTPAMWAAQGGHDECLEMLEQAGADLGFKDSRGRSLAGVIQEAIADRAFWSASNPAALARYDACLRRALEFSTKREAASLSEAAAWAPKSEPGPRL